MYLDAVKFKIREQIKIFNQSLCMLILKKFLLLLIVEKNCFLFFLSYVHSNYLCWYFT